MSQNNTIRKSDKKFIRSEKARIRRQFLDIKKQEELINNLYKKFSGKPEVKEAKIEKEETVKIETQKESKKPEAKEDPKKPKIKK